MMGEPKIAGYKLYTLLTSMSAASMKGFNTKLTPG
jgi:hypothetical protein